MPLNPEVDVGEARIQAFRLVNRLQGAFGLAEVDESVGEHAIAIRKIRVDLDRVARHTEGRGDKDEGVGAEQDLFQGELRANTPAYYRYHLKLPQEPWSYAGRYVNIIWEVEASIDLAWARDPKMAERIIMAH